MNKVLLVYKEAGYTSNDVVNIIKKKFNLSKVLDQQELNY